MVSYVWVLNILTYYLPFKANAIEYITNVNATFLKSTLLNLRRPWKSNQVNPWATAMSESI